MTAENKTQTKKTFSFDWLIGGVLSKLGDTLDRLTGRNWNPSSSLATSKLVEKMKFLLDSEVRDLGREGRFVPHVIKLKMQWDKFSADSEEDLRKLEHELHAAAIDHINDRLYHTYAPLDIEIKTDYFTEGVRMLASFGEYADREDDEVAVKVTVPNLKIDQLIRDNRMTVDLTGEALLEPEDVFTVRFSVNGRPFENELNFTEKKRISVGRTKENDLSIDDQSVSKIHAALVLSPEKQLMVADTGSTNGTYVNGARIAYGKAVAFEDDDLITFGTVGTRFERHNPPEPETDEPEAGIVEPPPTRAAVVPEDEAAGSGGPETIRAAPGESGADAVPPTRPDLGTSPELNGADPKTEEEKEASRRSVNLDETQDWEI